MPASHCCCLRRAIVGLANAGKSTLLNVLADGKSTETAPTIGLDVKLVQRENVTMKCWDLGGQTAFRGEWARYAADCQVILFVVDAHAPEQIPDARIELHRLLENRGLADKPICVVANKVDLSPCLTEEQIIKELVSGHARQGTKPYAHELWLFCAEFGLLHERLDRDSCLGQAADQHRLGVALAHRAVQEALITSLEHHIEFSRARHAVQCCGLASASCLVASWPCAGGLMRSPATQ